MLGYSINQAPNGCRSFNPMTIPIDILDKYRSQYEHGDYVEAKNLFGINPIVMSRILKTGRGSKKSVAMIRDFYNGKKRRQEEFLNQ